MCRIARLLTRSFGRQSADSTRSYYTLRAFQSHLTYTHARIALLCCKYTHQIFNNQSILNTCV